MGVMEAAKHMKQTFLTILSLFFFCLAQAQDAPKGDVSTLKQEIMTLKADVENVQLNLGRSHKKFQTGILVATLGYSITIAGGLMLGRENDDLGQALLVAGGATGVVGTYMLVDSFKFLGRAAKKQKPKP